MKKKTDNKNIANRLKKWSKEKHLASRLSNLCIIAVPSLILAGGIFYAICFYVTDGSGIYTGRPIISFQPEMRSLMTVLPVLILMVGQIFLEAAIVLNLFSEESTNGVRKIFITVWALVYITFLVLIATTSSLLSYTPILLIFLLYCFITAFIMICCLMWLLKSIWNWLTDKNSSPVKVNNDKLKIVWTVIVTLMGWLLFKR